MFKKFIVFLGREETYLPAKHDEDRKYRLKKSHCPSRGAWFRKKLITRRELWGLLVPFSLILCNLWVVSEVAAYLLFETVATVYDFNLLIFLTFLDNWMMGHSYALIFKIQNWVKIDSHTQEVYSPMGQTYR